MWFVQSDMIIMHESVELNSESLHTKERSHNWLHLSPTDFSSWLFLEGGWLALRILWIILQVWKSEQYLFFLDKSKFTNNLESHFYF